MADDSQISIDLCEMETELEAGAVKLGLGGVHGGSRLSRLHASQSQMARCRPVGQSVSCFLCLSLSLSHYHFLCFHLSSIPSRSGGPVGL